MIAEVAVTATLSAGLLGYMIGRAGKANLLEQEKALAALAREHARDWHTSYIKVRNEYLSAIGELAAIKRARSAAVAKGNTTRRLKREAAAEREGPRQSIVQ